MCTLKCRTAKAIVRNTSALQTRWSSYNCCIGASMCTLYILYCEVKKKKKTKFLTLNTNTLLSPLPFISLCWISKFSEDAHRYHALRILYSNLHLSNCSLSDEPIRRLVLNANVHSSLYISLEYFYSVFLYYFILKKSNYT